MKFGKHNHFYNMFYNSQEIEFEKDVSNMWLFFSVMSATVCLKIIFSRVRENSE
jgi:hypothetical protein